MCKRMHKFVCVLLCVAIAIEQSSQQESTTAKNETKGHCDEGECIPYYMCLNGTVITDGTGLLDMRFGDDEDDVIPCTGLSTCCSVPSEEPILTRFERKDGCGHRNVNGVGIEIATKNNETQFGEFPWTIAIFRVDNTSKLNFHCGGALIHPLMVLTAAHCVYGIHDTELRVRAGEWDTSTTAEPYPHQDLIISEIIIHENYDIKKLANDVALIHLSVPVNMTENVNTVCLPPQGYTLGNERCVASGWGRDALGKQGRLQMIQRKVDLPIVNRTECAEQLQKTRLGPEFRLHETFICAGGMEGVDTCEGDGGAPMVCPVGNEEEQYHLTGMVAWGIGCGDSLPAVYVNVALYRDWIDRQFEFKKLDKESYMAQNAKPSQSLDDLIADIFNNNDTNDPFGPIEDPHPPEPLPKPTQPPTKAPTTPRPTPAPTTPAPKPTPTPDPLDNLINPCGDAGECVPYYLCPNGTVITDGAGILDVRLGADDDPEPERHPCPQFFDTCCLEKTDEPIIQPVKKAEGCGWRNPNGIAFQVKERAGESQYAEFPWTIAIMVKQDALNSKINVYQCAGSLIHPSVVLTAAHCVSDKRLELLLVRAGEWDTQTKDEPFPHQDRTVAEVVIHQRFTRGNLFNDIALLILKEPVDLIENVNTICLPPANSIYDRQSCFAAGWGKNLFGKAGAYQAILKKLELPVVPKKQCQDDLRTTRLGKHFVLNDSFLCAGGERGKDTCTGDGGAALACEVPGRKLRYYEVGMVSWGIGCNEGHPGVYVNVPKFRTWIDDAFRARKLDTRYYELQ